MVRDRSPESIAAALVRATHLNSVALIIAAIIGVIGAVGGYYTGKYSIPSSQDVRDQISAQQARIAQLSTETASEKEHFNAEETRFQETEKQLRSELDDVKARLAGSQTNTKSKGEQLADAQARLESVEQELADARRQIQLKDQQLADEMNSKRGTEGPSHTKTYSPNSSQRFSSFVSPKRHVDVGPFRLEPGECARAATIIRCSGTVTNLDTSPRYFYLRWDQSFVVDNLHTQVSLSDQIFRMGDGTRKSLQPQLPIAFVISVQDNEENVTRITLVLSVAGSQFPLPMEHNFPVRLDFSVPRGSGYSR